MGDGIRLVGERLTVLGLPDLRPVAGFAAGRLDGRRLLAVVILLAVLLVLLLVLLVVFVAVFLFGVVVVILRLRLDEVLAGGFDEVGPVGVTAGDLSEVLRFGGD